MTTYINLLPGTPTDQIFRDIVEAYASLGDYDIYLSMAGHTVSVHDWLKEQYNVFMPINNAVKARCEEMEPIGVTDGRSIYPDDDMQALVHERQKKAGLEFVEQVPWQLTGDEKRKMADAIWNKAEDKRIEAMLEPHGISPRYWFDVEIAGLVVQVERKCPDEVSFYTYDTGEHLNLKELNELIGKLQTIALWMEKDRG